MRRAGPLAAALLLICLAALVAAPAAVADGSIPVWPITSFSLLFIGFLVVIVILVVSAAVLARVTRAERERRFDQQHAARLAERSAGHEALPASNSDEPGEL